MGRDQTHGVGSRNGDTGPFDHVDPADVFGDDGPVDITAVRRDDALIEAIAGDGPVATEDADEYQLAMLLASWRAEVNAAPMPQGPDLDTVVAAVQSEIAARAAAEKAQRWRRPFSIAAASVAMLALAGGVTTALSYNAGPGDPLWTVKQVVFSRQADSTMARMDVDTDLDTAEQLIAHGDIAGAKKMLDRASSRADDVNDSTHRDNLLARRDTLRARLEQLAPNTLSLVPPLPSLVPPVLVAPTEIPSSEAPSLQATVAPTPEPSVQAPETAQLLPATTEEKPPVVEQKPVQPTANPPETTNPPPQTETVAPVPTSQDTGSAPAPPPPPPPPASTPVTTAPAADTTIDRTAPPTETSTAGQLPPVTTARAVEPDVFPTTTPAAPSLSQTPTVSVPANDPSLHN